jgi:hypothetical protein
MILENLILVLLFLTGLCLVLGFGVFVCDWVERRPLKMKGIDGRTKVGEDALFQEWN